MDYKFDIEMTAIVNDDVVRNMVVAAVERQTGRQVTDIRTKYDGNKFTGYDIVFDPKLKSYHNLRPSKEFILNNFDEN